MNKFKSIKKFSEYLKKKADEQEKKRMIEGRSWIVTSNTKLEIIEKKDEK